MNHRRADVWLPATEPRCEPSGPCDRRWNCARWLAPIPVRGTLIDGRLRIGAGVECSEWRAVERPPASPVPRRVFPPLGACADASPAHQAGAGWPIRGAVVPG